MSMCLRRGDILLQVDGQEATDQNIGILLVGIDRPGSRLVLSVAKGGNEVIFFVMPYRLDREIWQVFQGPVVQVPLIRMASDDIKERQRVFELFEKLKVQFITDDSD